MNNWSTYSVTLFLHSHFPCTLYYSSSIPVVVCFDQIPLGQYKFTWVSWVSQNISRDNFTLFLGISWIIVVFITHSLISRGSPLDVWFICAAFLESSTTASSPSNEFVCWCAAFESIHFILFDHREIEIEIIATSLHFLFSVQQLNYN